MKNIITIGTQIETLAGFEQVTGYNGSIVYTDSYEVDMDGKAEKVGERKLTTNEIELLMREVDGKNHDVTYEAPKWYAVQETSEDAWDNGSYDYNEAIQMLRAQGKGLIAVINEETNYCEDEIKFEDLEEEKEMTRYRVKDGYADSWYGGEADTDYIEECQTNGIPQEDIDHMVREYGPEILDQLEEI